MGYSKLLLAAALAASAVPAAAAPVAATNDASGRALILVPLTLTKVDDLEFGTIVPSAISGVVSIDPANGDRLVGGGVTGVLSDPGQRAYFGGAGSPNQQVIVFVTPPAQLTSTSNPANTIPVLALPLEGSPIKTIHPVTRSFFFGVGGIILVGANQPEGVYEATFEVTASYQ